MKGLALETVVKWIILLVVAGVILNIIFFFSDEIKRIVGRFTEEEEPKAEVIEADKFSTSQIKTYIRACWGKTGEKFQGDVVCYILRGNVTEINPLALEDVDYPADVDATSKFIRTQKVTIIKFEDVGNKIILES